MVSRLMGDLSITDVPVGVTFIGAKDQIAKQLYAKGEIPRDLVYHVSGYLAKTVSSHYPPFAGR